MDIEYSSNLLFTNNTFSFSHNLGLNQFGFANYSGVVLNRTKNCIFRNNTFSNFSVNIAVGNDITLIGNTLVNSPIHIILSTTAISLIY